MKQKRAVFLSSFFTALLLWCSLSGLAAVNYHLEFGGFEGFFDRYRIERTEPLTLVIRTDEKEHRISLAEVNRIVSDPIEYILLVPRPLRIARTLIRKAQQELLRIRQSNAEGKTWRNAIFF